MSTLPQTTDAPRFRILPADDYEAFCNGVRRLCGIDLGQYKRGQMERRVRTFAERRGHKDLAKYAKTLGTDKVELEAFLDRMTINVSQLWRNPEQWTLLGRKLLPELAEKGTVRIWSAGSSYGAEAYTLAAVCRETVPHAKVTITGTDIDERMVARARQGFFSLEDGRDAPKASLRKWFEEKDGGLQAVDVLRSLCRFEQGDLLRVQPKPGSYDLVLCRNTVIYFEAEVRDALHERLAASVRPCGYFMIGSTERVSKPADLGLEPCHPFVYRKA